MDSVESFCNALARFKVMDTEAVRSLWSRWRTLAGDRADDVAEFRRWLVLNGSLTNFQLDTLIGGHGDHLTLDDYTVLDRIGRGG